MSLSTVWMRAARWLGSTTGAASRRVSFWSVFTSSEFCLGSSFTGAMPQPVARFLPQATIVQFPHIRTKAGPFPAR